MFNKGLTTDDRPEGLLKRLKSTEDKTDSQLDLIRNQGSNRKTIDKFYNGADREILELKMAINESIDNITNEDKFFSVKINNNPFKIDRYTNLAYRFKKSNRRSKINELEKKLIPEQIVHLAKKIEMMLKI